MTQSPSPSSMSSPSSSSSIGSALQKLGQEFYGDRPPLPEPTPVGYGVVASAMIAAMDESDAAALYALAEEILQNPEQVRQLGDRVYELLQNDIRYQRDRNGYLRR